MQTPSEPVTPTPNLSTPGEPGWLGTDILSLKDLYATLIATRNLEINLFWQRSNYFLVLNSAIALGFFNLQDSDYTVVFAGLGFVASTLWFEVCMGGKYWQTRWEQRLIDFENAFLPDLAFFAASRTRIDEDVQRGLSFHPPRGMKKFIYAQIIAWRPSVSYSMILLAVVFMIVWAIALGTFLVDAVYLGTR